MPPILARFSRALFFGALSSVLLLGTVDLALRLGPWVWILFAFLTLVAFLHAQEQALLHKISQNPIPRPSRVSRWLSGVPEPEEVPTPQLLQSHEELSKVRQSLRLPPDLDPRDEMRLRMRTRSEDLKRVKSAVMEMKSRGLWSYYAPRLWSDFRPQSGEIMLYLLKEGALVPRFDSQFDPLIFHALQASQVRTLHPKLLDALLALGASLSDRDLEDRNILEKRIDAMGHGMHVSAASDLRHLWELVRDIKPEYLDQLRVHAGNSAGSEKAKLSALIDEIDAFGQSVALQAATADSEVSAAVRRL